MQFFALVLLASATLLSMVVGNTIEFVPRDNIRRKIVFFPGEKYRNGPLHDQIPDHHVNAPFKTTKIWGFPQGWHGMFKALREDESRDRVDVIQGEIRFQGDGGKTFFDISAIHACCNNDGIHWLRPKFGGESSGCNRFPCDNSFHYPSDNTKVRSSQQQDFFCDIGFM